MWDLLLPLSLSVEVSSWSIHSLTGKIRRVSIPLLYSIIHQMKTVLIFWDIMLIIHDHPQKLTNFATLVHQFICG